jgi:hypothetical protein
MAQKRRQGVGTGADPKRGSHPVGTKPVHPGGIRRRRTDGWREPTRGQRRPGHVSRPRIGFGPCRYSSKQQAGPFCEGRVAPCNGVACRYEIQWHPQFSAALTAELLGGPLSPQPWPIFRILGAAPSRLIAKRPRVLFDGAVGDPGRNADSVPTVAPVKRGAQLLALPGAKRRPSQVSSPGASAFKPSLGALTDLLPLELGERRKNREKDIADQLVIRRQMRFAVAVEADTAPST